MITPIDGIQRLQKADGIEKTQGAQRSEGSAFGGILQTAIDNVRETDAAKNQAELLLATGQLDNPAELTIAATQAQLSVDLLVQLRNKALEAYSEISRISL